ncbi:nucleotide sugar dehydrogenase [Paraneptunicella aestuarii]|uniref:nucleotide sugar dehydrogenase n=1 Tax=Paraneptunicella aestuarii TaxID=2831148 RepID=UPI001E529049|nr:nucleotide sugar dehydrogenase [Paraneptunicella aestuarii]UAA39670.1 nucleotide sugar dehydrogenase [Paraneptunicella aestuarii]
MIKKSEIKICVIGIGYVGLPLAIGFSKHYDVIGFDLSSKRIKDLNNGIDVTNEVEAKDLSQADNLLFTCNEQDIASANIYIVTVPTPIDTCKVPDLSALRGASKAISKYLQKDNIVIYESTVYPGATEEVCVPVLEEGSGLTFNQDFYVGYSPERINPGDKKMRLENITKVVSGSTAESATFINDLYSSIISAGTYLVSSIKVAEAAKVIENTQRDVNIALMNELAMLFNKLGLNTQEVLEAAGTKWNFLKFKPGLVGGHCIGVDPYYLTHKAREVGFHSEMILSGRRVNDQMGEYVAKEFIYSLLQKGINPVEAKVLILGISFKEDCPDIRNTRVIDIYEHLKNVGITADVYDPVVASDDAEHEFGIALLNEFPKEKYDGMILAVAHSEFLELGVEYLRENCKSDSVIYDVKGIFPKDKVDGGL